MNYIVLDLEWNQPFNVKSMVRNPVMLYGEIIQIGAVKLDENFHIIDTFKIMVSPTYYRRMHKTVTKLTKITTEDLQFGFAFPVAFRYFSKWCGDDFVFLTWGPDDIGMLRDNLALHRMDDTWLPRTYNIQVIFDNQISKENRQVSLKYAMEKIGEPALEAHDALHDAKNTVCVCLHLDMVRGLAEYADHQKKMCTSKNIHTSRSEFSKVYDSIPDALSDPELIQFYCPKCGNLVHCVDIVKQNSKKYIGMVLCDHGDELLVRFKFTSRYEGGFYVSRILYEMDENNRAYYLFRKQYMAEQEAQKAKKAALAK